MIEIPPPLAWNLGGALTAGLQLRLTTRRPLGHPRALDGILSLQIGRQPFLFLAAIDWKALDRSEHTRDQVHHSHHNVWGGGFVVDLVVDVVADVTGQVAALLV